MKKHILIILALMVAPFVSNAQSDCSLDFIWELVDQAVTVQAVDFPEGSSLTFTVNGQVIESVDDAISVSGLALLMPITVCVEYISSDCPDGIELCETFSIEDLLNGGGGGNDCVDPSLINPNVACPMVYMPVCGCNGVTYGNECEALNYGGVTEWTDGPCEGSDPQGCVNEEGVFFDIGAEWFINECEYYACEGPNNWSSLQEIPGCGVDCEASLNASLQGTSTCNYLFEIEPFAGNTDVFWDFGDGSSGNGYSMTEHMYSEDGVYPVIATYWNADCGLMTLVVDIVVESCGDVMPEGCIGPNGDIYAPGDQLEVGIDWCDNLTCTALDAIGEYDFVLNSELYPWECENSGGCDHTLIAGIYEFSPCTWEFSILADGEFAQVVWDFGDGETSYDGYSVLHDYAEDGLYVVSVTYWSAECGLMTLTTEIEIDGCGDIIVDEGCYNDLGVFYPIGSELWLGECSYLFCENEGQWSDVIEIPGCGQDFGCYDQDGDFYLPGEELIVSEDYCENYTCSPIDPIGLMFEFVPNHVLYPEACNNLDGCFSPDGLPYMPGQELMVSDCEYMVCLGAGEWSEVMEIPDCGEVECVNEDQIMEDMPCPDVYFPVCGCDGVTYGNECEAYFYGGVTEFTDGPCDNDGGTDDECIVLYDWFINPNGVAVAEAYGMPDGVDLVWTVDGDIIATGTNVVEFNTNNLVDAFELCVSFEGEESDDDDDDDDDENDSSDCEGAEFCEMIAPVLGGIGCFYENGQFYPVGFELWVSECEYFECSYPGFWSELMVDPDCGNEIDCELAFEYEINPNGYLFAEAVGDYPSIDELAWYVNDSLFNWGTSDIGLGLWDVTEDVTLCVVYYSEECGEVVYCEDVWEGVEVPDCTLDLWSNVYDSTAVDVAMFEAYNYPENATLFWMVNGEFFTQGTHYIELPQLEEGYYEVCVGYETPECPQGVFECVDFILDPTSGGDDCTVEIESYVEGNIGVFQAYGYPEDVWLGWMVNGEFVSDNSPVLELVDLEFGATYDICVVIEGANCWTETCEQITIEGSDGCPEQIIAIPPKWGAWCEWAFEIPNCSAGSFVQWDFGDNTIENGEDSFAIHTYPNSGEYIVTAFVLSDDCPNGVTLTTVINVFECDSTDGISGMDVQEDWQVYPVPTRDQVRVSGLPEGNWTAQIFDPQGRIVLTETVVNGESLDLNALRNGWYTMQIVGIATSAKRVVIQR